MNKQNSFSAPTAQLSRHPHNVSAGYTFSMSTSHIIPFYFDIAQPGDKYYFATNMWSRLQDVTTAFLGEVDIHIDYFFVPLSMIYTPFGQVFGQTNDFLSTSYDQGSGVPPVRTDRFPLVNMGYLSRHHLPNQVLEKHFECWGKETARLLDALDFNPLGVISEDQYNAMSFEGEHIPFVFTHNPVCTPWALFAYQACYQKYYRNDDLETFRIRAYNIDWRFGTETNTGSFQDEWLFLRYHQRLSDYFTTIHPSPMYSAVNTLFPDPIDAADTGFGNPNALLNKVSNYLGGYDDGLDSSFEISDVVDSTSEPSNMFSGASVFDSGSGINNASRIRSLFAIDKFLRVYGRAGKTYDDQILAHFGVKIPHDVKHDLTHICHYKFSLQADPVYSTAAVDGGSALGQVGGQASNEISTDQETFRAPVHGVFIGMCYALTRPRYQGTFSKLHLLTERLKFPIPEFDKLGSQPMYSFEFDPAGLQASNLSIRFGWQRRYAEFKQRYNRISMAFNSESYFDHTESVTPNLFNPWVLSRAPFDVNGSLQLPSMFDMGYLFETPHSLDNVMEVPFNHSWSNDFFKSPHLMFQTDPIIMESYVRVKKVSWMSETGEPDL